jgi:DNA mismatch repair protein MutH
MKSTAKLLNRCQTMAGLTIQELSSLLNKSCPKNLLTHKGWIGQLLEQYLDATASNQPTPDFPDLGIELKTIPVTPITRQPIESTYICTAPINKSYPSWEDSVAKLKLSKILWVPIESNPSLPLPKRRIGRAFLWQPTPQQVNILKNDWQELTEMIQIGDLELLSAKYGRYLQIRPKAANCQKNLVDYITRNGELIKTVNRGFYLRTTFTKQILIDNFK